MSRSTPAARLPAVSVSVKSLCGTTKTWATSLPVRPAASVAVAVTTSVPMRVGGQDADRRASRGVEYRRAVVYHRPGHRLGARLAGIGHDGLELDHLRRRAAHHALDLDLRQRVLDRDGRGRGGGRARAVGDRDRDRVGDEGRGSRTPAGLFRYWCVAM